MEEEEEERARARAIARERECVCRRRRQRGRGGKNKRVCRSLDGEWRCGVRRESARRWAGGRPWTKAYVCVCVCVCIDILHEPSVIIIILLYYYHYSIGQTRDKEERRFSGGMYRRAANTLSEFRSL
jgi:hypothetical protein